MWFALALPSFLVFLALGTWRLITLQCSASLCKSCHHTHVDFPMPCVGSAWCDILASYSALHHQARCCCIARLQPCLAEHGHLPHHGNSDVCYVTVLGNGNILSTLDTPVQAVNAQQKALVSSPIKSLVCRHAGPVHAISASLHHPALLISCGLDGQVRLCSSLARQPLLELAPSDSYLFSVQWSPHRPMLFAVGAGEGGSHVLSSQSDLLDQGCTREADWRCMRLACLQLGMVTFTTYAPCTSSFQECMHVDSLLRSRLAEDTAQGLTFNAIQCHACLLRYEACKLEQKIYVRQRQRGLACPCPLSKPVSTVVFLQSYVLKGKRSVQSRPDTFQRLLSVPNPPES